MKQYYPYETFRDDVKALRKELKTFEIDTIVGVARGGLTLAHALGESLELRRVETLRTELYDATQKREHFRLFGMCDLSGSKHVLVVDDIADSGETLEAVMKSLRKEYPEIVFTTATLFYKKSSCFEPDFWVHEAKAWIEFFWESDFLAE